VSLKIADLEKTIKKQDLLMKTMESDTDDFVVELEEIKLLLFDERKKHVATIKKLSSISKADSAKQRLPSKL